MNNRKGIGYKRVSTHQQVDKFGFDVQQKMIEDYAKRNNIEIVAWVEESYTGDSEYRPEMNRILNGEFVSLNPDCLIVAKSDRLARNIEYYYAFKLKLREKCRLELMSVNEDFGQMGMFAPVMEAMIASYAEIERTYIAQRTSAGREAKRRVGGYCGGSAPFGYYVDNKRLIVNEEEAPVIETIFELREQGLSFRQIADCLNSLGLGRKFHHSMVGRIVNNEKFYRGLYRYGRNKEWVQGQHEAILKPLVSW